MPNVAHAKRRPTIYGIQANSAKTYTSSGSRQKKCPNIELNLHRGIVIVIDEFVYKTLDCRTRRAEIIDTSISNKIPSKGQ